MKMNIVYAVLMIICLGLAIEVYGAEPNPVSAQATSLGSIPPSQNDSILPIVKCLPESTLAVVEIRNLAQRWSEIRNLKAIAALQDLLLDQIGLSAADVPRLAGNQAVVALLVGSDGISLHPVLALSPEDPAQAESTLRYLPSGVSSLLGVPAIIRHDRRLWLAAAGDHALLSDIVENRNAGVYRRLPWDEFRQRLPGSPLVRGWIHPAAVSRWARTVMDSMSEGIRQWPAALLSLQMQRLRYLSFSRDIEDNGLTTEVVALLDPAEPEMVFPPALRREAPPLPMPASIPEGALLIAGLRLDPSSLPSDLERLSLMDAEGPFRHLGFWLREFEAAAHIQLERSLKAGFGEFAWLALARNPDTSLPEPLLILETRDNRTAEELLLHYRDWSVDHLRGRSLGLTWPYTWNQKRASETIYGVSVLGHPAWCFSNGSRHLVLGGSTQAVKTGAAWMRERGTWKALEGPLNPTEPLHFAMRIDGTGLAEILSHLLSISGAGQAETRIVEAVLGLLNSTESICIAGWPEADGIRYRGRIQFNR